MEKFQNKYKVDSNRLKGYDYSQDGSYFINICTNNMYHYFGSVQNNKMHLNKFGRIVDSVWQEIPRKFPNVILDEFIIMPNHMHGIIIIINECSRDAIHRVQRVSKKKRRDAICPVQGESEKESGDAICRISKDKSAAINHACTNNGGGITGENNPMGKGAVGEIVRWFKGRSSYEINKIKPNFFTWQSNYYEHIIRNHYAFENIKNYIINNPINWIKD